ncbi:MAG: hypothetical protein M1825_003304 [Sarcosagium campestre]|nr:MAG: hypothetical protein M1825_003304 [Sarcosagium campestre]
MDGPSLPFDFLFQPADLPFSVDPHGLAHPIPTADEVQQSNDVIYELGGRKIVGIGPYAVKFGPQVDLAEGQNMLFVARATSVPVPRIYALFREPPCDSGQSYIVMERVIGETLDSCWLSFNWQQKEDICMKLRSTLQELRSLPSPGSYCSLGQQPLLDYLFWNDNESEKINGPFGTEEELNNAMIRKYVILNNNNDGGPSYKAEFYRECLPSVFRDHPAVFTHGDFQRKNIVLRSTAGKEKGGGRGESGNECEFDFVLLDWEFAGCYPSYWEYSRAMYACGRWDDDWCLWLNKIFAPDLYINEWAWMSMLLLELWS